MAFESAALDALRSWSSPQIRAYLNSIAAKIDLTHAQIQTQTKTPNFQALRESEHAELAASSHDALPIIASDSDE